MVKVLLDDIDKVLSGVDQRHRGLVDAPDGFTCIWSGRTGGDYCCRWREAGGRYGQRGGSRTPTPSPRPLDQDGWSASTTCFLRMYLLFSLLMCTRVRAVVVGAAAVKFAVVSLSLPLPSSLSPMPPCSGSHFGFLVSRPFSQPTSFLTNLLVSPREVPCAPLPLLLSFYDLLCSPQMPFLSFPGFSLFVLTHPFLTYPASW